MVCMLMEIHVHVTTIAVIAKEEKNEFCTCMLEWESEKGGVSKCQQQALPALGVPHCLYVPTNATINQQSCG